jgi:hypothetical protein
MDVVRTALLRIANCSFHPAVGAKEPTGRTSDARTWRLTTVNDLTVVNQANVSRSYSYTGV